MSAVSFFLAKLAVQFAYADVWIPTMIIADPLQFLLCVCIGVLPMWPVRFGHEGFFCPIVLLIPPHKGSLGDVIPPKDKVNVLRLTI